MKKQLHPVRTADDFLIFGAPLIGPEEKAEVMDCLDTGWIGTGPKVAQFESEFQAYIGAEHAVAVHSCTAALHLSMLAAGVGPGDEVITTPLTFVATVNTIIHAGATPVLADVDPHSFNLDPAQTSLRVTGRTRAIIPVHFAGRPCDMVALGAIAKSHDLLVIEDCAHSIETTLDRRHAGTFGKLGCFSFYSTKNLTTGEGGMVTTADEALAARLRVLALHGLSRDAWKRFSAEGYQHYHAVEVGFKYNMMDLQAALGLHQLRRLETNWLRRREIWKTYQEAFAELPLVLPAPPADNTRHAYHLYTILVDPERAGITRDEFLAAMTRENIGVGVHYQSVPMHPVYRERFGWRPEDYPESHRIGEQTVSLPLSAKLNDRDVEDVIRAVRRVLGFE
ncbi:MAG TPA: DegT/DnrJ/EryC1/StrS family aminotransferase [Gemmatimonadales bacterium]|jgi:dTDP-4-amino-4,6-dideoxygalactose transaminase|nr:DegT/DnrJ/EryC1/StrS family aminotransferase [Gemmatimonadales bacterium]